MSPHASYRAFLSGTRENIERFKWVDGKMNKTGASALVLSKGRPIRLGPGWRWTHIRLNVNNVQHRIWICYHPKKENYLSVACQVLPNDDLFVLAALESHGTHPGWHVHGCCTEVDAGSHGRLRYPNMVRIPSPNARHRQQGFPANDEEAMDIAARHFRIEQLRTDPSTSGKDDRQWELFPS